MEPKDLHAISRTRALWRTLLWGLAWLPALLVLFWIESMRIRVPYHDSWAYVEQYQSWCEGQYGWRDLFRPHNGHPATVGKLVYFGVLHGLKGEVSILPLASWLLSLLISSAVFLMARPLWKGSFYRGPILLFLANLSVFTGAQGHTWVWDFVFQNFIAGACLVGGMALLRPEVQWRHWRGGLALLLSVIAANSFGSGFTVGFLLMPVVWAALPADLGRRRQVGILASWGLVMILATWLAHDALHGVPTAAEGENRMDEMASRPLMAVQYTLVLLGHTLGQGLVVEAVEVCMVLGGVLLALFGGATLLLICRCRSRKAWRTALPWLVCCTWAVGNAALICLIRMGSLLDTALAPRYATFMLFMVLGVVLLAASFWHEPELRELLPRQWVKGAGALTFGAALLLAAHFSGWSAGYHSLLLFHERMTSEVAASDFVNVLPVNRTVQWDKDVPHLAGWLNFLNSKQRLKGVKFVTDVRVSQWRQGSDVADKFAGFDALKEAGPGRWLARGRCGLSKDRVKMADLILLSASGPGLEERFISLAAPVLPEDFHQRLLLRRLFPEHYLAWEGVLELQNLPGAGPIQIKAYAYDAKTRRIRPLVGEHLIDPAASP